MSDQAIPEISVTTVNRITLLDKTGRATALGGGQRTTLQRVPNPMTPGGDDWLIICAPPETCLGLSINRWQELHDEGTVVLTGLNLTPAN